MSKLVLGYGGIVINWEGDDTRGAAISSNLKVEDTTENSFYNAAIDGMEAMILAHFCAGVKVNSEEYLEGIESSCEATGNNIDEPRDDVFEFNITDETQDSEGDITGTAKNQDSLGLSISLNGFSDCSSEDNLGCLVYIENYDNNLQVRIYGDINKDEPTHNISLEGARNELRD